MLLVTSGINEQGNLTKDIDLPFGKYYLKELETDPQFVLDTTEYDFKISYQGQDVEKNIITIGKEGVIKNYLARGDVSIKKTDVNKPKKKMKDVEFNISDKEDMSNIVETAKTDKTGIATFKGLELGTYYIQEAKQVDGYVLNDTIYKVEVKKNGDLVEIEVENKPTEMQFTKVDITNEKELEGATMSVSDKETGKIIDQWVSTKEPHSIKYLVEGKEYILTEIKAPKGYQLAESIMFVAKLMLV